MMCAGPALGIYSFWQYASISKLDFLKIEFQCKTRFLENRVIAKLNFKKKIVELEFENFQETRVSH